MIMIRIGLIPAPHWVMRLVLQARIALMERCAVYHERRAWQARLSLAYARNHGTLPRYEGYYHEVLNESATWIRWAHSRMVVAKSDLARLS